MSHSKRIEGKTLIVETKGQGPTIDEVKEFSKLLFEFALKNNCKNILADDREQICSLSDLELFELGEYHASSMPAILKFAVVTTTQNIKRINLWENTAFNRGRNVKVFDDINTAKKWLNEE